jgi:hypothetical protein
MTLGHESATVAPMSFAVRDDGRIQAVGCHT